MPFEQKVSQKMAPRGLYHESVATNWQMTQKHIPENILDLPFKKTGPIELEIGDT